MARKKFLVIPAGGSGVRMGAEVPKQFLLLDGKPILRLTIERFLEAEPGVHVVTVLPEAHMGWWRQYCAKEGFTCPQKMVAGGFTRFHSVKNALQHIPDGALVAVHDAVRPLVSVGKIKELFAAAENAPAVIPATPCTDTLKSVAKNQDGMPEVTGSVDRSAVWGVQTPQIFHSEVLKKAYERGFDTSFTDDASVVSAAGVPVICLEGERTNIKITTPEDLSLAQAILSLK
ncbi:MAG: 2-C-methyl-D-erythritol 4-phosphate cytidylyltransferase [Bacteroidales bacterium]|nr:2-C-methyl-D-erythritol 4-phosphate cytidylyltransferase [Bacteroidales bacterium]